MPRAATACRQLGPPQHPDLDYAANFADFLDAAPPDTPWCFWFGALEPHRGYEFQSGMLLGVLRKMTPGGFERFSKYLLRVYGFERVEVTPAGKDGGIDGFGVLQINPFVSFKVIFQCKKYRNTVSRAQVGDLRNAMIGRADKGIMITTGNFSEDAKREVLRPFLTRYRRQHSVSRPRHEMLAGPQAGGAWEMASGAERRLAFGRRGLQPPAHAHFARRRPSPP